VNKLEPIRVEADFRPRRRALVGVRKRAARRYDYPLATPARLSLPDGTKEHCWAHDLSEVGIGLEVARPLEPGTPLLVHLKAAPPQGGCQVAARVVHATEVAGGWRVGCAFAQRLTAEQVERLLAW
jgi:hypothetical protein